MKIIVSKKDIAVNAITIPPACGIDTNGHPCK